MPKKSNNFDSQNILPIIQKMPEHFLQGFFDNPNSDSIKFKFRKLFFGGMGGSALPVNLLQLLLKKIPNNTDFSLSLTRDYCWEKVPDNKSSVILISYSGETEETLSLLKQVQKTTGQIIILAKTGTLLRLAKKNGWQHVEIPDFVQPRFACSFILGSLLKIFYNSKLIKLSPEKVRASIQELSAEMTSIEAVSLEIAKTLKTRYPLIYTDKSWRYLAEAWKINFNENAKIPAFYNIIPEMCHNELVGFSAKKQKIKIILLVDPQQNARNKKRFQVIKELLSPFFPVLIIEIPTKDPVATLISLLRMGTLISYHLAIIRKTDPAPVNLVEKFKKLLA